MDTNVVHHKRSLGLPTSPERLQQVLDNLPESLVWHTGAILRGVTFRKDEEGWLAILKATVDGNPVVHFTGGRYWQDLGEILAYEILSDNLVWYTDRYAK